MSERRLIALENTKFIYKTNFSGDPERDTYGSDTRKGNIIIPDERLALELMDEGFNVKKTKPRPGYEDEYEPVYYISAIVNYDTNWPPRIYLVSGNAEPLELDEDSIVEIDRCYVRNVNVTLNPHRNKRTGRMSLYVRTMYVEQDLEDDPFAHRYARRNDEDGTLPF